MTKRRRLRIGVLALDFDGTVYNGTGPIDPELLQHLRRLRRAGVKLVLATGRCLLELERLVDLSLFDAVVAENGAILSVNGSEVSLAPPGWETTRLRLRALFETGNEQVIISLDRRAEGEIEPYLGPETKVEFNKDRLMIMPASVDKGSGLSKAIGALHAGQRRLMCVGDGENDLAMFRVAILRVAVGDSVEVLKREADYISHFSDGKGVLEAVKMFISNRTE